MTFTDYTLIIFGMSPQKNRIVHGLLMFIHCHVGFADWGLNFLALPKQRRCWESWLDESSDRQNHVRTREVWGFNSYHWYHPFPSESGRDQSAFESELPETIGLPHVAHDCSVWSASGAARGPWLPKNSESNGKRSRNCWHLWQCWKMIWIGRVPGPQGTQSCAGGCLRGCWWVHHGHRQLMMTWSSRNALWDRQSWQKCYGWCAL